MGGAYLQEKLFLEKELNEMTVRELIEELIKHDMEFQVYLINGNDLMWPSKIAEARIKLTYTTIPPKLYDAEFLSPEVYGNFYPNSLIIHWT